VGNFAGFLARLGACNAALNWVGKRTFAACIEDNGNISYSDWARWLVQHLSAALSKSLADSLVGLANDYAVKSEEAVQAMRGYDMNSHDPETCAVCIAEAAYFRALNEATRDWLREHRQELEALIEKRMAADAAYFRA
jgi:hypothetical protein